MQRLNYGWLLVYTCDFSRLINYYFLLIGSYKTLGLCTIETYQIVDYLV